MKPIIPVLLLLVLMTSCSKKLQHCSQAIYPIPGYGAFIGFTASELDTIVIEKYQPGSQLSQLLDVDTVSTPSPVFNHDTAYRSIMGGFFNVGSGVDYKILLPGANRSFVVTQVTYGDLVMEWEAEICRDRTFVTAPYKVNIDGQFVEMYVLTNNNNYFYLK